MDYTFPIVLDDSTLQTKCEMLLVELDAVWQKWISDNAPDDFDRVQMLMGVGEVIRGAALMASEPIKWLQEQDAEFTTELTEKGDGEGIRGSVTIEDKDVALQWKLKFGGSI